MSQNGIHPPRATSRAPWREKFRRFATGVSAASGSPWTFFGACLFLVAWSCSYPLFLGMRDPFDAWQLVINTVTTIITFLMVFLIQNTQNRDAKAIHLKLDELIRAHKGARNRLVELENCTDEELERLRKEFARLRAQSTGHRHEVSDRQLARVEIEQQNRDVDE